MFFSYVQLALAVLVNIATLYFIKKANGFTVLWPTIGTLVASCTVQWLQSRVMANGMNVSLTVTIVVVSVMLSSVLMSVFVFNETLSSQRFLGLAIAVIGVAIATTAKI